jgi:hypothetical protein
MTTYRVRPSKKLMKVQKAVRQFYYFFSPAKYYESNFAYRGPVEVTAIELDHYMNKLHEWLIKHPKFIRQLTRRNIT